MRRFVVAVAMFAASVSSTSAADVKAINESIEKGKAYLQGQFKTGGGGGQHGTGPAALAGVAMLEARVPADDPAIKAIATAIRNAAYTESQTYQLATSIIFLDKLEDPADVPLIQMLAMRLAAGQNSMGGWGYPAIEKPTDEQVQWLRANLKPEAMPPKPPKFHPDVAAYAPTIKRAAIPSDDNSNTQFGILGLWLARKHGVPVEPGLDLIDKRFRAIQDRTGGWSYMGPNPLIPNSPLGAPTPSMTCCGLLGLATGNARRIEKRIPKEVTLKSPLAKADEPFFSTPGKKDKEPENGQPELRDPAALKALALLGEYFAGIARNGGVLTASEVHGDRDYYFIWSIERVGVIYNLEKLGGVNWYDVGSEALLKAQGGNGAWPSHGYGSDVNTAFALLFLCKADLLRDLSKRFRKDNELRAGNPGGTSGPEPAPMPKGANNPTPGTTPLPSPVEDESTKLASQLVRTPATEWTAALHKLRDAKGADNTRGLVIAIHRLEGDRRKEAREALAERLTRMSAETLTGMIKAEDAELRRGAALAAAMKDDKAHIPDLIERLTDDDDLVVRAAKAGLKSLSGGQDFGPKAGATKEEAKSAAAAWKAWWDKNKK